ncbi:CgeB family protein [Adhaeribacter radiodurans]|uniref:Glycosyltransferase n=1 Tax=Adhaeribacter radiodurans TaxID=2745197 RepID=A0A7L7L8Z1_9BACT|nr:glycosyltransferase [Adhaeribacter radiodurans]QMU29213.1 glycosyltransferase [Adhaeribacter radiodurans]
MKIVLFYHSLLSDWNHGNAHFLRGIVQELKARHHQVQVFEPENGWSLQNLVNEYGQEKLKELQQYYPGLETNFYNLKTLDLDVILQDADLVLVHEWSEHELVKRVGEHRTRSNYKLLFHDTHHRAVTEKQSMAAYDLTHYDGVLAFGEVIKNIYLQEKWTKKAYTWHEAADTTVFYPHSKTEVEGDLVWIGNWGDEERTAELHEFLINPVKDLGLKAKIYGVRYPEHALKSLADAGIEYGGWLPNYKAPEEFAKYKVTVHVPRRPYVQALPGIPTIRPFEALSCGIPLITAPWEDAEHLFTAGQDFLVAQNGEEMKKHLQTILSDNNKAQELATTGLKTIQQRHTCAHRVNELEKVCEKLEIDSAKIYGNKNEETVYEK